MKVDKRYIGRDPLVLCFKQTAAHKEAFRTLLIYEPSIANPA